MKFILVLAIFLSLRSYANDRFIQGGEMPFPIGKTIELPMDDISNEYWEVPKIDRYIKINYLEKPTPAGNLIVELLNYRNQVIAEGVGRLHPDKILRSVLKYKRLNRFVSVMLGSYCDEIKPKDGSAKFTRDNCSKPRYVVTFEQIGQGAEKSKMRAYNMHIRTRSHD